MRNLLLLCTVFLFAASCKAPRNGFTKKDVESAQKLYGLVFEKEAIDTMYNYLGRNKRGYESMRRFDTDLNTFPAVTFDPHPHGFKAPLGVQNRYQPNISGSYVLPETDEEIAFLGIKALAALIKSGQLSSTRLTQIYLDRIEKYDPQLLSVITVTDSMALAQARRADEEIAAGHYRGILHGIPYGVKDLMAVKGYPTTWGAAPYQDQMLDETATVVNRLEQEGAVLIAKLVSGTLARGDVWFGGQTKNPWDLSQGASGSSAGSGSATSAGLVAFSLGTETLGSITSPSSRNGVTGLRPTYGRVSRYGVMSLSWSMDKIGPICRSAEDCEIVFNAIYGFDEHDPTTNKIPLINEFRSVEQMKIGYLKADIDRDSSDSGNNLRKQLTLLKSEFGIDPDSVGLPRDYPYGVFDIILRAEAGTFFYDLIQSGDVDSLVEQHQGSRANSLRQARFIPAVEYLQANRQRRDLIEEVNKLFKDYDVIIAPTSRSRQLQITNLTGHPVITVPTGFDEKGRPTSMTFIGNLYREGTILKMAKTYQSLTEYDEKHPPLFYEKANADQ
jgi:Asp-tRNA(Asn)/Glu-tRNA(Gln) amidotransferase A subunit family amidase